MKITITQVEQMGMEVAQVFAAYNPAVGGSIVALLATVMKAQELAQKVLAQAQENPEVRDEISAEYQTQLDKWMASVAAHPGAE